MSLNIGELVAYLRIDDKGFDRGLDSAQQKLSGTGSRINAKSVAIGSAIGTGIGLGVTKGVGLLKDFASGSVEAFSEVEDATGAAGQVFGDSQNKIVSFADSAASKLGIAKASALNAAITMGTFGKGAGLAGDDLAKFSTGMTSLAGDLASFRGTSPEQAIEAVGAALRGETEPIRQYGVMIDQAAVQSQALSMGLVKAKVDSQALRLAQERADIAQRRYNEAVRQHGASSLEARSASASLSSATAAVEKASKGSIPPLTQQQRVLATQALILKQTKDAQGDYARTADSTANVQKTLTAKTENAQAALGQKLAPAITKVRLFMINLIDALTSVSGAISTVVGWFDKHRAIAVTLAAVVGILTAATIAHSIALSVNAAGSISAYLATLGPVQAATKVWTAVQWALNSSLLANPITWVVVAVIALVGAIVYAWKHSEKFRTIVLAVWSAVKTGIGKAVDWIVGAIGWFKELPGKAQAWFGGLKDAAVSKLLGLLTWVRGLPGRILDSMRNVNTLLVQKGKDIVWGLIDGIKSMGSTIMNWVKQWVLDHIPGPIAKALNIGSPSRLMADRVGRWIPAGIVAGIDRGAPELDAKMRGLVKPDLATQSTQGPAGLGGFSRTGASGGPSLTGLSIEGTLDLGNGLTGYVRGIIRDTAHAASRSR